MNHTGPHSREPEDLSQILGQIASSAENVPGSLSTDVVLATARRHGLAARRRQSRARALIAVASIAAVAATGIVISQNIGGGPVAPAGPAANATSAPTLLECGARAALPAAKSANHYV